MRPPKCLENKTPSDTYTDLSNYHEERPNQQDNSQSVPLE